MKIICLVSKIRNKLSSIKNCVKFRIYGIKLSSNLCVHGKVTLKLGKHSICRIGNNFYLSSGANINPLCANGRAVIYAAEKASIRIGDNVGMSSAVLWAAKSITIGNYVKIGANVKIIDTDAHSLDWAIRRNRKEDIKAKSVSPVVIEDDVLIGMNCIILKGVTIGARSVIGAGSVVVKSIPPDCIAAGNPCRVIRQISENNAL